MYPLQPPTVTVKNLLNQNGSLGQDRLITWTPVNHVASYNIYRSFISYNFKDENDNILLDPIATVNAPATTYTDTNVGIISNADFTDLEDLTVNTWGGWYYAVSAVRSDGTVGLLSEPVNENSVSLLRNPPFGEYQIGTGPSYGYCNSTSLPTSDDTETLLEIRARNLNLLQRDGTWVWYFKQRAEGQRCSTWVDDLQQCSRGKNCPECHGVGLKQGYYAPVKILVRLVGADRMLMQERFGLRTTFQARSWTIWEPRLATRDIIVAPDGRRYEINKVESSIIRGGVITHQTFDTIEKWPTDWVYTLPVPGPLY